MRIGELLLRANVIGVEQLARALRVQAVLGGKLGTNLVRLGYIDLETLARIAARLAGRDPDEHVEIRLGDVVPFSGAAWRYPDFVSRAVAAYDLLKNGLG